MRVGYKVKTPKSKTNTSVMSSKQNAEYRIAVVGPGGVGKSSLTINMVSGDHKLDETIYDPTIEDVFRIKLTVDGVDTFLEIIDTAGQEEYRALRYHYMHQADGFLMVCDLTSQRSLEELSEYHEDITRFKDADTYPVAIACNKLDLVQDSPSDRLLTQKAVEQWAAKWHMKGPIFETSAKTKVNCKEAFEACVRQVRLFREKEEKRNAAGKPRKPSSRSTGLFGSVSESKNEEDDLKHI